MVGRPRAAGRPVQPAPVPRLATDNGAGAHGHAPEQIPMLAGQQQSQVVFSFAECRKVPRLVSPEPSPVPKKKPVVDDVLPIREPGRMGSAWSVLRGQRLVPVQIQAEWLTYRQIFDDVLTRLGAQLARQAKAHAKSVRAQLDLGLPESQEAGSLTERKHALRMRFAQARGMPVMRPTSSAVPTKPEVETP